MIGIPRPLKAAGQAPGRRQRDAAGTREAITVAAQMVFDRRGYEGTTVREVAAEAGITQGLVTRYFGSKEDCSSRPAPRRWMLWVHSPAPRGFRSPVGRADRGPLASAGAGHRYRLSTTACCGGRDGA